MVDHLTQQKRSWNMSRIPAKNTKPELLIRKFLHRKGYRYRLHCKYLPGKPDIFMRKYSAIIQIQGCFWHGHNCYKFRLPKSNTAYWKKKIERNIQRDKINKVFYEDHGYRCLIIWECSLFGKCKLPIDSLLNDVEEWIKHGEAYTEISGCCHS